MGAFKTWLTTRRLAGIAGLAYVVGAAIENMEILGAPTLSGSAEEIRDAYADQALGLVTTTAGVLALIAYAGFALALYVLLRERASAGERWPTLALVGGIGGPLLAAVGIAASAALVAGAETASEREVETLYEVYLVARLSAAAFAVMFLAGVGVAAWRSGALPPWLAALALAIAAPMALGPVAALTQSGALELVVALAFAAQSLWVFLASGWLLLADGAPRLTILRRGAFLLLVIAAALIGIALVAVPGASATFFAWGLGPEPLAAFAGGVYIGAAAAYAAALPAPAGRVRGLVAGAAMLSVSVLIISLTHSDQFDFDRLQAWAWMVLFGGFSAVTILLLALDRGRAEPEARGPALIPGWTQTILATAAAGTAALAVALWIDPTRLSGPWPYELAPLGGRFAGSWLALIAVCCAWSAVRARADEARLAALVLIALPTGALLAGLRTIGELEPSTSAGAYLAACAALALAGVAVLAAARRARPGTPIGT